MHNADRNTLHNVRTSLYLSHAEVNTAYSNTVLHIWYLYILHSNEWGSVVKMKAALRNSGSREETEIHTQSGKVISCVNLNTPSTFYPSVSPH
jgi:hypothetical protein